MLAESGRCQISRSIRQSITDQSYIGLGSATYIALGLASLGDLHNAAFVGFLDLVIAGSHILGHFHNGT